MTPVRMDLLGGFEVTVEGRVVPARAWTRRQAATLVKLGSCRRLVNYLHADELARLLEDGEWQATFEQVQRLVASNGRPHNGERAEMQLLALWLRSLPESVC